MVVSSVAHSMSQALSLLNVILWGGVAALSLWVFGIRRWRIDPRAAARTALDDAWARAADMVNVKKAGEAALSPELAAIELAPSAAPAPILAAPKLAIVPEPGDH